MLEKTTLSVKPKNQAKKDVLNIIKLTKQH